MPLSVYALNDMLYVVPPKSDVGVFELTGCYLGFISVVCLGLEMIGYDGVVM